MLTNGHVMPGSYTCTCRQVVMPVCPGSNRVGMGWIHVHSVYVNVLRLWQFINYIPLS